MPFICIVVVFVALIAGDGYYFDGRHVTAVIAGAKEFDAAAEKRIGHMLHFNK
jgi:hypothetical protein